MGKLAFPRMFETGRRILDCTQNGVKSCREMGMENAKGSELNNVWRTRLPGLEIHARY
jgi:hypothetical protein